LCAFMKTLCALCGFIKTAERNLWSIIILIILISGNIFAQRSQNDSILFLISKETSDTARIKLMVRYALLWAPVAESTKWQEEIHDLSEKNNYRPGLIYGRFFEAAQLADSGKYDEAIRICKSCIDGLDSLGIIQPYGYPLYQIRFFYFLSGRQIEMFRYYTEKIAFYKRFGPVENTAAGYHGLGRYYLSIADYDKAIGYFMRAQDVFKSFDPLGELNDRGIIGSVYLEWGNLDKAEQSLRFFLDGMIRLNDVNNSNAYDELGNLYFAKKDYKQALNFYLKEKDYYVIPHFQASNLVNIALVYLQLGSHDSALIYLDKAEKIRQKEKSGIYFASNFIGLDYGYFKYYAATGNIKFAQECLKSAIQQANLSRDIPVLIKYTNELSLFFLQQGDSLQALRFLMKYHSMQDSLNELNMKSRIATFEIEQKSQLKENEIEHLQTQKTKQRNYYLIGGALLLLLVFAGISRFRYKRKRDDEQLKTEFKKQLAQAETKALRAQMNPHFIFNSLNSINSFVIDQKHEIASDYLIKFSKLIRLILDNSRSETISLDKELETLKLYVLLESARFDNKFVCVYNIAEDVNTSTIMIPPMLLQPFVENAIWHGLMQKEGEGTITVEIKKQDEDFLDISIIDNGIGREKAAQLKSKTATHTSHGLKVTSQRIDMMNKLNSTGAQVNIIDLKDDQGNAMGTKVELIIPV
jgi:tetratricopeptide (TPR) repeat protein